MLDKMRNNKKYIIPLVAFFIPVFSLLIYTFWMEITSKSGFFFNGENYLMADMSSQYSSMYSQLINVFRGGESMFYSFSKGIGGNMMSTVGYYLASPLNLIFYFASKTNVGFFIFILLLIKLGLCGLFMYIFLSKKFNVKSYSLLIFSSIYALMAYNVAYYFNNMWLDVVYITPLVLLGLDKLLNKESPLIYILTLAFAIISNFYIAYMLCLFICIYFIYELLIKYTRKDIKEVISIIKNFVLFSLLAGGISAFLLIPSVLNLREIMRFPLDTDLLNVKFSTYSNLMWDRFFSKIYLGSHIPDTVLSRQNPNLYTGIITSVLLSLYYFNRNIKLKEKILTTLILLLFFISFLNPYLNLIWHGFSFPNGYTYRFSFLFSLFLILISCKSFINLDIRVIPMILVLAIGGWISYNLYTKKYMYLNLEHIKINFSFIIVYLIMLILIKKINHRTFFRALLILVVFVELTINLFMTMITNVDFRSRKMHGAFYNETCSVISNLEDDFYRVDGDYLFSYLDGFICNTSGFTTSLTTNNGNLYRWLYDYGYPLNYTTVVATPNNPPVLESLLGIKYFYSKELVSDYYKKVSNFNVVRYNHVADEYYDSNINIYKNNLALSLGYLIDNNYDSIYKNYDKSNPFEYINALVSSMVGEDIKVYSPLDKKKVSSTDFKFKNKTDEKYLYVGFRYKIPINVDYFAELYVNGDFVNTLSSENSGILRMDNNFDDDINLSLRYLNEKEEANKLIEDSIVLYTFNNDKYLEVIDKLNKNQMKVDFVRGNKAKGYIKSSSKSTLFTSIPYEKGWKVYVDGKKQKTLKIGDEWVGVELDKGEHIVEFKFIPTGLYTGLIISISSITILVIYAKRKKSISN